MLPRESCLPGDVRGALISIPCLVPLASSLVVSFDSKLVCLKEACLLAFCFLCFYLVGVCVPFKQIVEYNSDFTACGSLYRWPGLALGV